jgi:hypothetical protein
VCAKLGSRHHDGPDVHLEAEAVFLGRLVAVLKPDDSAVAREPGCRWGTEVNAFGALTTFAVRDVVPIVNLRHGAWIAVLAIPFLVLILRRIRQHYSDVRTQLSLSDSEPPRTFRHTVILPVPAAPNRVVLAAVEYAKSTSEDVIAVHVRTDGQEREELLASWKKFVDSVPLILLDSPYRSVLRPLLRFIDEIRDLRSDNKITVVLPEFVPAQWWHKLLHNQTSSVLKDELRFRPGIMVTTVPYHFGGGLRSQKEKREGWLNVKA